MKKPEDPTERGGQQRSPTPRERVTSIHPDAEKGHSRKPSFRQTGFWTGIAPNVVFAPELRRLNQNCARLLRPPKALQLTSSDPSESQPAAPNQSVGDDDIDGY